MGRSRQFSSPGLSLTAAVFYMLLSLSLKDRHGYDILKHVQTISAGRVRLGPGTLYTTLKRMLEAGLITELAERPASEQDDARRRYYRLTARGRELLEAELSRMKEALVLARGRNAQAAS